jgi:hypothetical protein
MVGTTLGHYRIEAEISQGGMGTIYRAVHAQTGQVAAIKVLRPALAEDRHFLQRFRREMLALQEIHHPNVIEIYEVGSEGNIHYYAMEYLGKSLADLLVGGPLAPRRAVAIAREVAQGLEAAHAAGFFHRDIKPGNILFADDGRAKITDFGIAKVAEATRVTQTGAIVGTPTYMAPEQAEGPNVDARADVYSLGCVLYEMLVGRPPFDGHSAMDVLRKHRFSLPEHPKTLNPQLPLTLCNLVLQMLEKSPTRRPPTMAFLASAFEHIERNLTGEELPAPRPAVREPSAATIADRYERTAARLGTWAKRLAALAALALLAYVAYRAGAYLRRGPADYFRDAQALETSDEPGATRAYESLLKRYPGADEAEQAKARIAALRERARERERAAKSAIIELAPRDNTAAVRAQVAYAHFRRAEDEAKKGRVEHACEIYRRVREQFADTPWAARADARLHDLEAKLPPKKAEEEETSKQEKNESP